MSEGKKKQNGLWQFKTDVEHCICTTIDPAFETIKSPSSILKE